MVSLNSLSDRPPDDYDLRATDPRESWEIKGKSVPLSWKCHIKVKGNFSRMIQSYRV